MKAFGAQFGSGYLNQFRSKTWRLNRRKTDERGLTNDYSPSRPGLAVPLTNLVDITVLEVVQGSRSGLHRAGRSRFIAAIVEHAKDAGRHGWWTGTGLMIQFITSLAFDFSCLAYLDVCSQLRCVDAISPSISAGDFMYAEQASW